MRHASLIILLCIIVISARPASAAQSGAFSAQVTPAPPVAVLAPLPGQPVQGMVAVHGTTGVEGFQYAEVSFGYANDTTATWFLIARSTLPVTDGLITTWDTTTITDGNYNLRLVVALADGRQVLLFVPGLRVRNYSPIETDTPTPIPPTATSAPGVTPIIPTATPAATATVTPTPLRPTPTSLPTNPAEVADAALLSSLATGATAVLAGFAALGGYLALRVWLKGRS